MLNSQEWKKSDRYMMQISGYKKNITEFCGRWNITEFSFFGSILKDDFKGKSDIDVLVEFSPDSKHNLFDLVAMQEELSTLFGRKIDLIEKSALRNPFRKYSILKNRQVVYVS